MTRYEQTIEAMKRHLRGDGILSDREVRTALDLLQTQRSNIEIYQAEVAGMQAAFGGRNQ